MSEHDDIVVDDDSIAPADQQENEEDIALTKEGAAAAVMFNTDWTVETLYSQIKKGNINLDPKFQRREAWDSVRKSKLIESIICSFPIPNVVLAEDKKVKGRYLVIDGKQRLFSIYSFLNNELALTGLETRSDLNGLKFEDLKILLPDEIPTIENQPIRTIIIRNWTDEDYLYAIFYRLNSGSLPLSSQELRKALHGGKLLDYIDDYIAESKEFKKVFGEKLDRRMRDVELVLRFVSFDLFYESYKGNLKKFLDDAVIYFDKDWDRKKANLDHSLTRLTQALNLSQEIFGDNTFKKYNGTNYERRVNRAVFDVITRYFSQENIDADQVRSNNFEIIASFEKLCEDERFREAIERTTKSPAATNTRHRLWGELLAQTLGRTFDKVDMRII
jgi:hypothetical protein